MKPLIVANWKCNPQKETEAKKLFNSVINSIKSIKSAEVIICPPFIYLSALKQKSRLGAQNCFWEEKGAYTGEVSASMIKNLSLNYVILGHSERRRIFNETDEVVNKKIRLALKEKLIPIFCIGETQEERDKDETESVLKRQIISGLEDISAPKFINGIIAYEPVWAIGTGNPCDIDESQKMRLLIMKIVSGLYSPSFSKKIPILYGGSVNSANARGYIKEAGFNGLLVGGASLDKREFVKIVKSSI